MSFNVLIIGIGNLGIRNIQGLLNLEGVMIHALDTDMDSVEKAKEFMWQENMTKYVDTNVFFYDNLCKVNFRMDLIIISTTARGRAQLISEVLINFSAKFMIIEKVVAQSVVELQQIKNDLQKSNVKAWINLPRRIMPSWQKLKSELNPNYSLDMIVSGGKWGLASNSIHMLNLAEWLSESKIQKLTSRFTFEDEVYATKRRGYLDTTGELFGETQANSTLRIISNGTKDPLIITLLNNNNQFIVNEFQGHYTKNDLEKKDFKLDLQSEIINPIVLEIMNNSSCSLPIFESIFTNHVMLIKELTKNPNFKKLKELPIT